MKNPLCLLLLSICAVEADPILSSWHTADSGTYARLWPTTDAELEEKRSTTGEVTSIPVWDRGDYPTGGDFVGEQATPTYGGVQRISFDDTYVYIESTGLPTNVMGPWYDNVYEAYDFDDPDATDTRRLFPAFPENVAIDYRFPKTTDYPIDYESPLDATPAGSSGLFVNGVPIFNTTDTFSYNTETGEEAPRSDGFWNRDAFTNEGPTFDSGNSHQAQEQYHYHASPAALRHQLGDSVDYDPTIIFSGLTSITGTDSNPYIENFNGNHSPIIGWVNDGIPIYGPYGYSDPLDPESGVRRMITGFQLRDGTNDSTDIAAEGRSQLPQWSYTLGAQEVGVTVLAGPDVDDTFFVGRYQEDYAYKGDLENCVLWTGEGDYDGSIHFDLNQFNARWCVTPEFPDGRWVYFTAVEADGTPVFPYNLTWAFLGDASVGGTAEIPTGATLFFEGAASKTTASVKSLDGTSVEGELTIVWDGLEGGEYRVGSSADLTVWDESQDSFVASAQDFSTSQPVANSQARQFYRITQLGLDAYEDVDGVVVSEGNVTIAFTFTGDLPPDAAPVTGVEVGGVSGSLISYTLDGSTATVEVTFDSFNSAFVAGSYPAMLFLSGPPPDNEEVTFTSENSYDVDA